MANNWARKATEREREISVAIYHFFEKFASLVTDDGKSDGWAVMISEGYELGAKYPEARRTIDGLMQDISNRAKEHSQNG